MSTGPKHCYDYCSAPAEEAERANHPCAANRVPSSRLDHDRAFVRKSAHDRRPLIRLPTTLTALRASARTRLGFQHRDLARRSWQKSSSTAKRAPPACKSGKSSRASPASSSSSLPAEARKDRPPSGNSTASVDVVILCLPDEAAKEAAQLIDAMGADAPAGHRRFIRPSGRAGLGLRLSRAHRRAGGGDRLRPGRSAIPAAMRQARSRFCAR